MELGYSWPVCLFDVHGVQAMTHSADLPHDLREDLARVGDRAALAGLLVEHAEPLHRWVERRLDRRLRGRVSASDVVQEVYLAADHRLEHFGKLTDMPFGVWIRLLAQQRLIDVHRRYLVAEARDVDREVAMDAGSGSGALATRLAGHFTTPSRAAIRHESGELLTQALDALEPSDRDVLVLAPLRGVEQRCRGRPPWSDEECGHEVLRTGPRTAESRSGADSRPPR